MSREQCDSSVTDVTRPRDRVTSVTRPPLVTSNKWQRWLLGGLLAAGPGPGIPEFDSPVCLTSRYSVGSVWGLNRGMNADDGNRQNIEIEVSQSTSAIIAVAESSVRFKFLDSCL